MFPYRPVRKIGCPVVRLGSGSTKSARNCLISFRAGVHEQMAVLANPGRTKMQQRIFICLAILFVAALLSLPVPAAFSATSHYNQISQPSGNVVPRHPLGPARIDKSIRSGQRHDLVTSRPLPKPAVKREQAKARLLPVWEESKRRLLGLYSGSPRGGKLVCDAARKRRLSHP
jgi:hypothetical protein